MMAGTPARAAYAIACGIFNMATVDPAMTSPEMYESLYFGSHSKIGRNV